MKHVLHANWEKKQALKWKRAYVRRTDKLFMLINTNNNVMQALFLFFSAPHSFCPRPSSIVHTVDLFVRGWRWSNFFLSPKWLSFVCICLDGYDEIMECFIMTSSEFCINTRENDGIGNWLVWWFVDPALNSPDRARFSFIFHICSLLLFLPTAFDWSARVTSDQNTRGEERNHLRTCGKSVVCPTTSILNFVLFRWIQFKLTFFFSQFFLTLIPLSSF